MNPNSTPRFMNWRDLIISPAVEFLIFAISALCTYAVHQRYHPDFFVECLFFYGIMVGWTLLALKIIRWALPLKEGVYVYSDNPSVCYRWNLHGLLCATNLGLHYVNALMPTPLRKTFYQLLGAKMGKGIIMIGGRLFDPQFITLEENVMIGDDALLTPHTYASIASKDLLILGKIEIKRGAIIGAKSMIMPGVTVGEGAMVNAMSLVAMNTKIPAYEIWGGNPAKKIGEIKAPGKMGSAESIKETEEALRE